MEYSEAVSDDAVWAWLLYGVYALEFLLHGVYPIHTVSPKPYIQHPHTGESHT